MLVVDLGPIVAHTPAWLLVLFRLTGVFAFAPLFGSQTIPARLKVLLALGLSFCVYPLLLTGAPGSASAISLQQVVDRGLSLWFLVGMVGSELLIGLVIGFGASLPLLGMQLGGHVIAQQVGFGLAEVFNPSEEQSGLLSEMLFLLALAIFLILGGHRMLLITLVGSFQSVPLGGFVFDDSVLQLILGLLSATFDLAIRVAAPLLCLIFLETLAMGFIARTVPQMNILSIGFALRILVGMAVVIGGIGVMSTVYSQAMRQMIVDLCQFFVPGVG